MCSSSSIRHIWFHLAALVVILIVGATVGSRHVQMREFNCLDYRPCPKNGASRAHSYYNNNCVSIVDATGLAFVGQMEPSNIIVDMPTTCWSDGFWVTINNPTKVMNGCFIGIGVLAFIYILIHMFLALYCKSKPSDAMSQEMIDKEEKGDATILCGTMFFFSGIITLLFIMVVIPTIAGVYSFTFKKATCTKYVVTNDVGSRSEEYGSWIDSVIWETANKETGTLKLLAISNIPSQLPQECWISTSHATFYTPTFLYQVTAIIWACLVISSLLIPLCTNLFSYFFLRRKTEDSPWKCDFCCCYCSFQSHDDHNQENSETNAKTSPKIPQSFVETLPV